ncbi:MAG: hypothetical protein ACK5CY_09060 [Bacteroidia bacterium]
MALSILKTNAQIYSASYFGTSGVGIIYYPNGYYYGEIYNGFANGQGVCYWSDGSFYYGGFYSGYCNGAGVLVSKYGYISGCWYNGSFIGNCPNGTPYNQSQVENIVFQVQDDRPEETRDEYPGVPPEKYKITKIDPNTQMGRQLLGKLK